MTSPALLPHTGCHWRRINEQNVCWSSLDLGLVLGPLSQMTINYHQQVSSEDPIFTIGHLSPSSREAEAAPRHDPVLIIKTPAGELEQWRANYRWWSPGLCQLSPHLSSADWCLRHSIRQQNIHQTGAWEQCRVTPVDRCQAASDPTCVTITIPCSVHRKLSSRVSPCQNYHYMIYEHCVSISRLNGINLNNKNVIILFIHVDTGLLQWERVTY